MIKIGKPLLFIRKAERYITISLECLIYVLTCYNTTTTSVFFAVYNNAIRR